MKTKFKKAILCLLLLSTLSGCGKAPAFSMPIQKVPAKVVGYNESEVFVITYDGNLYSFYGTDYEINSTIELTMINEMIINAK